MRPRGGERLVRTCGRIARGRLRRDRGPCERVLFRPRSGGRPSRRRGAGRRATHRRRQSGFLRHLERRPEIHLRHQRCAEAGRDPSDTAVGAEGDDWTEVQGRSEAQCLPTGVPRQAPYPWRILQTPTHMYFLFEGNIHSYRQIFLDGRTHPEDPDPTWYGQSIGTWDGDTLVIDSVGFNDRFWFDFAGHPHTEQLHTIERFRRPSLGTLEYEVTIDDPGAYTAPFTLYGSHTAAKDTELMEYICNENNQDVEHIVGKDPRKQGTRGSEVIRGPGSADAHRRRSVKLIAGSVTVVRDSFSASEVTFIVWWTPSRPRTEPP